MTKRLLVIAVLLMSPGLATAQCQPTNSPTLDFSLSKTVDPSQVPFAAVTLNFTAADGTSPFHNGKVGTGTHLLVNWKSWNTASPPTIVYKWDYQTVWTNFWYQPTANNGTYDGILVGSQWAGHVINFRLIGQEKPGSGSFTSTTQDVVNLTVTNQAPGIYSTDNNPSNRYVMVSLNFNGTPNIPYLTTCPNAAEKDMVPTAQLQLANTTSGETRNGVTLQGATTVVGQPVSATAYDYISWLPGDVITTESGGFVYCSALGDFWNTLENPIVEPAITRVSWNPSTHATKPYCTPRSSPPDYPGPAYVPTNWKDPITGQGPAGFMDWEAIGVSFMGPWVFPYSINGASGRNVPGIYPPVVPDCTNESAGIFPPVFPY